MWYFLRNMFIPFVVWFLVIYGVGSFTAGSLDIHQWTPDSRYAAGGVILALGLITGIVTNVIWNEERMFWKNWQKEAAKREDKIKEKLEKEYEQKMKQYDKDFYR